MKTCFKICALLLVMAGMVACTAPQNTAPTHKTAVVFDEGANLTDHSFNQMAADGARKAAGELKTQVDLLKFPKDKSSTGFYRYLAENGYTHIVGVGYLNVLPVIEVAADYPNVKFTVVDGLAPPSLPNVKSVRFKDNEGAFLVGMIAAAKSKTGKIAFIGALEIPLVENFAAGYQQGARYQNPEIQIVKSALVTDKNPWRDPVAASEATNQAIDFGADVIFAAAGESGMGALKTAADRGVFAIGVDFNQNGLHPGKVLTSMVKRLDGAVYDAIKSEVVGNWKPGRVELGLKENGVDYTVDDNNKSLIPTWLKERVEQARQSIVAGKLKVFSFREKVGSETEEIKEEEHN